MPPKRSLVRVVALVTYATQLVVEVMDGMVVPLVLLTVAAAEDPDMPIPHCSLQKPLSVVVLLVVLPKKVDVQEVMAVLL